MNIIVLNGSPKGDLSVTLQYVRYAARKMPQHSFTIFPVAQTIRKIEKDEKAFGEILDAVERADAVWWAFPLYYLVVCSQYKRFIELIFERKREAAFAGKYALSLSTSVHFFDHTAHNYIHAVCDDLQMNYLGAYSAAMYDLMQSRERKRWLAFAENFADAASRKIPTARVYPPVAPLNFKYIPGAPAAPVDTAGKKILLMKDGQSPSGNVDAMVQTLRENFRGDIDVVNLMDINIKGGCLGCCKCGLDNVCDYEGKDGYIDFYNEKVKKADVIIFAGAIFDRYLSSRWKMYFDRSFFNTHIPTLQNKQIAYLISGPLEQIPNLRQMLEAYGQIQDANVAGIITDESSDSQRIDALIAEFARTLIRAAKDRTSVPLTFLGVGGRKIFRDEIYGMLRFTFQADYRFFKQHGLLDFPQKNYKVRRLNLLMMLLTKIPAFRRKYLKILKEQMVKPLKQAAENKE